MSRYGNLHIVSLLKAAATGKRDLVLDHFRPEVASWVVATGLGPWLWRATRDDPARASSDWCEPVRSADLTARVLTGEILDATAEILEAAARCGLKIALLKGISICDELYPEAHLRPMADVDLLVERDRVEELEEQLLQLGYQRKSRYPPAFYAAHHHTCPFYRAATEDWVELHTALFPPESAAGRDGVFDQTNVMTELSPSTFRGFEVRRLSLELQIVYTASHWAFELGKVGAMVPMIDLILLLKVNQGLDWEKLLGWLDRSPAAACHLYLLLSFLHRHRLVEPAAGILTALRKRQRPLARPNLLLAWKLLERYALRGASFGRLMTERNFGVIWSTLLQPDPPLRNLLRLPARLIPDRFRRGEPAAG